MKTIFKKVTKLIQSPNKWILVVLPILFLLSMFVYSTANAQMATIPLENELATGKQSKGAFDFNTTRNQLGSFNLAVSGCKGKDNCPDTLKTGAIHTVGNMIASLYSTPPASGVTYAYDVIQNLGFIDNAYAQTNGAGFNGLAPMLPIWKAFRNISYILFILIFVFTGLAIMFRLKLNPQTVITIQSALPQIVITLLLVTFSYAIAGFIIDLIYVIIALIALTFNGTGLVQYDPRYYFDTGGFTFFKEMLNLIPSVPLILGLITTAGAGAFVAGPIGAILLSLILGLLLLYLIFQVFLKLLMSYLSIVLGIALAPIQITIGVLPGMQQIGFGSWFKNIFANAMVFPTVAFLFFFADAFSKLNTSNIWTPPFLAPNYMIPISSIISFGILLLMPQAIDTVKKIIGSSELESGIGKAWNQSGIPGYTSQSSKLGTQQAVQRYLGPTTLGEHDPGFKQATNPDGTLMVDQFNKPVSVKSPRLNWRDNAFRIFKTLGLAPDK